MTWLLWSLSYSILGIVSFGVLEASAFKTGHPTLSLWVWNLFRAFPLIAVLYGLVFGLMFGGLSVHFFWHWCPVGSISQG